MSLQDFLQRVKTLQTIEFSETIAIIAEHFDYQPTEFSNGLQDPLVNQAGQNEGSCKIFAFAKIHHLTPEQTLGLFGGYYRKDVLEHPEATDHQNIRRFICDGWAGIRFNGEALRPK